MKNTRIIGAIYTAVFSFVTMSSDAALISRLGGQAYYDDVLDITWIANANLAASNTFGLAYDTDLGDHPNDSFGYYYQEIINTSGIMTWGAALHWIDAMNKANYLGYNDWRLPTVSPIDGLAFDVLFWFDGTTDQGYNISAPGTTYAGATGSEMAHMYFNTLGLASYYETSGLWNLTGCSDSPPFCLTSTGPFSNLQPYLYWSGTKYGGPDQRAWTFDFGYGYQQIILKDSSFYAWAVRDGDVGAVIVPITIDIKPGSDENPINPGSKGKLTVAILTTKNFDASTVDVDAIRFGPGAAHPVKYSLGDVDSDTDWDLVLHFNTQDTGIICGETEAVISGQTFDGVEIRGTDSIKTVECKKK